MGNDKFEKLVKRVVAEYANKHLDKTDGKQITEDDVFIVWICKALQNNKALASTTLSDGMYYELTYNGDKEQLYLDAYKKWENVCISTNVGESCREPDPNESARFSSPFYQTVEGMLSPDYKERFRAEYIQTKIRYERLKAFNTKIEAANRTNEWCCRYEMPKVEMPKVEMPKHDCPDGVLREQQEVMGHYLHILEVRAVIEGVDLGGC